MGWTGLPEHFMKSFHQRNDPTRVFGHMLGSAEEALPVGNLIALNKVDISQALYNPHFKMGLSSPHRSIFYLKYKNVALL